MLALPLPVYKSGCVQLTDRDKAILDFERSWWNETGSKETYILERFELSPTRYYQILNELIDSEAAYLYDPLVIRRLQRWRECRRRNKVDEHHNFANEGHTP